MEHYLHFANTTFRIDTPIELTVFESLFPQFVAERCKADVIYTVHIGSLPERYSLTKPVMTDRSMYIYKTDEYTVRQFNISILHDRDSSIYLVRKNEYDFHYDMYIQQQDVPVMARSFRILNIMAIEEALLYSGKITLHGVILQDKGDGFVFTAPSGTGKSTITNRWAEMFSDSLIINGDCTVIGKENGIYYVYGSPFCGSSQIRENKKAPLNTVIRLYQGQKNRIVPLSDKEKFILLYEASTVNHHDSDQVQMNTEMLYDIISSVRMIGYECINSPLAAEYLRGILTAE